MDILKIRGETTTPTTTKIAQYNCYDIFILIKCFPIQFIKIKEDEREREREEDTLYVIVSPGDDDV